MKLLFQSLYRGCILFFVGVILLSCWAGAQQPATTNAPAAPAQSETETQAAGKTLFQKDVLLTFGLDRVPLLSETRIAGFPLWQYLASLIYFCLAFGVSKLLDYLTRVYLKRW